MGQTDSVQVLPMLHLPCVSTDDWQRLRFKRLSPQPHQMHMLQRRHPDPHVEGALVQA